AVCALAGGAALVACWDGTARPLSAGLLVVGAAVAGAVALLPAQSRARQLAALEGALGEAAEGGRPRGALLVGEGELASLGLAVHRASVALSGGLEREASARRELAVLAGELETSVELVARRLAEADDVLARGAALQDGADASIREICTEVDDLG